MLRSFDGLEPQVADTASVDEAAAVVGDVVVEADAGVWPNATLRGDRGRIVVVERATVGEGTVVAAGGVVTEGTDVPSGTLVAGSPAEPKAEVDDPHLEATADRYADLARRHGETAVQLE